MVAEAAAAAEIVLQQSVAVQYHHFGVPPTEIDAPSPAALLLSKSPPSTATATPPTAVFQSSLNEHPSVSFDLSRSESVCCFSRALFLFFD